jgi:hypothetical protein
MKQPNIEWPKTLLAATIVAAAACAESEDWSKNIKEVQLFRFIETPFRHVQFSISLSTNLLAIGTTNTVRCQLENGETNAIAFVPYELRVQLTNSSGNSYFVIEPPEPKLTDSFPNHASIDLYPIGPGGSNQWTVAFVVGNSVKPGAYRIVADQIVVQQGTTNAWNCESGLNVNVQKGSK